MKRKWRIVKEHELCYAEYRYLFFFWKRPERSRYERKGTQLDITYAPENKHSSVDRARDWIKREERLRHTRREVIDYDQV